MRYCSCVIIICVLFYPCRIFSQDITGLWKGTLHNDTTGRNLRYEIAISEKNGKLSGYSHTFFILDDKEYFGVKKVSVKREDDKIIIQEVKLLDDNYPVSPAKNVHQLDVLTLEVRDNQMILSGPFTTNRTKEYHSLTGSIYIERKTNYMESALVPHLEEMGLAKDLSFVVQPSAVSTSSAVISKPAINATNVVAKTTPSKKEKIVVKETKPIDVNIKADPVKIIVAAKAGPAADVNSRKIETIQSVYYKADSLVLTLYDNGVVDGDTVSVLMNGEVIMPMVGLSTRAVRKTIYITKQMPDSIQLIMYAENLGSIPPNTGLLVVHDGEDIYEIRFSGDYTKNAAIVFRRKKE